MKVQEFSREKLRRMSDEELAEHYKIPLDLASCLRMSLDPKFFNTLTNPKLTIVQMSEELGIHRVLTMKCRFSLIKTGFERGREDPERENIIPFYLKGRPSTNEEIGKALNMTTQQVQYEIHELKRKGRILTSKPKIGSRGTRKELRTSRIMGSLTDKTVAYLPEDVELYGEKITEHLPQEIDRGTAMSISIRLKGEIPKQAYDVVHEFVLRKSREYINKK